MSGGARGRLDHCRSSVRLGQSLRGRPCLRDRDTDANGTLDERLYALQDPNWNVIAIADTGGDVSRRYAYSAYGHPMFLRPIFMSYGGNVGEWEALYTGQRYDRETGLYNYRNRYYHPDLGRFVSRDPISYDGGINLYEYVGDSPCLRSDPSGLWGDNIHSSATAGWAQTAANYPAEAAGAVGSADAAVDSGGTGPMPWQDQSYHFNRNLNGGNDTRMDHFQEHFNKAAEACLPKTDDPQTAAKELGTALHPLQDWVAHGDHCMTNPGSIGEVHNSRSPQTEFGDPSGYPDDPTLDAKGGPDGRPAGLAIKTIIVNGGMAVRDYAIYERGTKRLHLTADITIARLNEFRNGIDKKACKCRKYFGF